MGTFQMLHQQNFSQSGIPILESGTPSLQRKEAMLFYFPSDKP